jgi:hypothetical protein
MGVSIAPHSFLGGLGGVRSQYWPKQFSGVRGGGGGPILPHKVFLRAGGWGEGFQYCPVQFLREAQYCPTHFFLGGGAERGVVRGSSFAPQFSWGRGEGVGLV